MKKHVLIELACLTAGTSQQRTTLVCVAMLILAALPG